MKCPSCNTEVQSQNINIQTDVAQCQSCQHIFKVSENIEENFADGFELYNPPKGAWIRNDMNKIVIGATTRSAMAFFLVPFMLIWSGFSIGGIYGTQLATGEFVLFKSLFGIPFLLGSIIFWSIALMTIWGKVEITLDNNVGKIFTGVGKIGFSKSFTWDEISTIREKESDIKYTGSQNRSIQLEGKRRISFGNGVSENRRYYLLRALKSIRAKVKTSQNFE